VLLSDFNYDLPPELIAQQPLADRAASRLLHLNRTSGALLDRCFRDFPELLRPDDLVVFRHGCTAGEAAPRHSPSVREIPLRESS